MFEGCSSFWTPRITCGKLYLFITHIYYVRNCKALKLVVRVGFVFNSTSVVFLAVTCEPSAIYQPYIFNNYDDFWNLILPHFRLIPENVFLFAALFSPTP